MAICLNPQQSDFRGYPFETWTQTKTEQFQKNNCSSGQIGSWVEYSKTYTSTLSEEDLQQQIADDTTEFNAAGQSNANTNGSCTSTCIALPMIPTYDLFAMSSSQVWLNGLNNTGVLQPYTKTTVISSASLPAHATLMYNNADFYSWKSPYPHNSSAVGYHPYITGTTLFVDKRDFTSGNACTSPTTYTVGVMNAELGKVGIYDFYIVNDDAMVILVGYSANAGKNFDIWYWQKGLGGTLLYTIERPKNYKYVAYSGKMAYNGTDVYYMLSFASRNNAKRTLTALFKTELSFGVVGATSKVSNWSYSNKSVRVMSGGFAASKLFFIYMEDGTMKTQQVIGSVANPPSSMYGSNTWYYMRDPYSTNNCYFGNIIARSGNYNRLVRYNAVSNIWDVINNN